MSSAFLTTDLSEQITPLFKANTKNPKRLYEILKGVSLKKKDLGHMSISRNGISVKTGATNQFQAVTFIPREFFYHYTFNGTEPLEIVITLSDLYGILGTVQDGYDSSQDQPLDEEFISLQGYSSEGQQQLFTDDGGNEPIMDNNFGFNYEASFEYEKEGATFNVKLFDNTVTSTVEIIPVLQEPLHDIPEPSNRVILFKILCYELKRILRDCIKIGSKFRLNGYKHEKFVLRFSSRNEYQFVEHFIRCDAFHHHKIDDDFQFTYPKHHVQPLLSLLINKKENIEVAIYTNGLMKMKFCPGDVQNSYINYMMTTMVEDE
ncbi:hypothetical protein RclHR1_01090005 [Rhizophagus clarus]|uniref:Uncharacterized protein n=1 Tax=Rhizophagus clarus TaxID=94130 RepID=A0A2Z6QVN7_9GLOM|nr:hypothetical protein RclHR1_01090005 [Rhizophagus clarus]GET04274.1 hypothetical protein GLOIN_2v1839142 [Rhizophagus clarus]